MKKMRTEEVAQDDAVREDDAEEEDGLPQHARGGVHLLFVVWGWYVMWRRPLIDR